MIMSHIVSVAPNNELITDIPAFKRAVESLGLTLDGAGNARYYGGGIACDYVVKLPGRYDLGLKASGIGYTFTGDSELFKGVYGSQDPGRQLIGQENASILMQRYSGFRAVGLYELAGSSLISFTTTEDGSLAFELSEPTQLSAH
jgi:hypothetical protein